MKKQFQTAVAATATTAALCFALGLPASQAVDSGLTDEQAAALAGSMPRAALAGESIYFVMPDRYANGDPSNDQGGTGLTAGGVDLLSTGFFHGGDLKGLLAHLDRIHNMGFTALWITPVMVNRAVQGGSAGYHGYWGLDFTKVDPHFGSDADLKALVDAVHANGMKLYLDIVVNHTADVITYVEGSSYSETPKTPIANESAQKAPAFLQDVNNYHNRGSISNWADVQQLELGDFYGLDDLATEKPVVVEGLADVWASWVTRFGIDGFRIDTAKHVDDQFFKRWVPLVYAKVRAAGMAVPQMYGEMASTDLPLLTNAVRNGGLQSVLDFPLDSVLSSYAATGDSADLKRTLAWDDFYNRGAESGAEPANAYSLVTFAGNHDEGRLALRLWNANARLSEAELLARTELAYAMLFTMRGSATMYYGDEVGMVGLGSDKTAREDMFPTQVPEWKNETRIGMKPIGNGSSLTITSHPMMTQITALNALRAAHPAIANGAFILRATSIVPPALLNKACPKLGATKAANPGNWKLKCSKVKGKLVWRTSVANQSMAWSRIDAVNRVEYLVVANAGKAARTINVATSSPGTAFSAVFGGTVSATSAASGQLTVAVPARTLLVLQAQAPLPTTTAAPAVTLTAAKDVVLGAQVLTATLAGSTDPATVTFVGNYTADGPWFALGSDDNPSYKLALSDWMTTGRDRLIVAAIVKTSDGKIAYSAPLSLTL